ncbi:MAG: hypothetical protein WDM89_17280 [Rhizomicrobium sp.]
MEIITLKARYFMDLGAVFHDLSALYHVVPGDAAPNLSAAELGDVQEHFENVLRLCGELKLPVSAGLIRSRLDHAKLPRSEEAFSLLRDAVYAELKDTWFAYIPTDRLDYFDTDRIVSFAIRQAFPSASEEIKNAGTCYAMGLATASVFHAMRAVEIGIQVMAAKLNVTLGSPIELSSMGPIIGGIEDQIREMKKGARSAQKDEDIRFYSEAAAQFRHFNNGWRIRAAHARATYEDAQAKAVLDHVIPFFETLTERLAEPE